MTKFWHAPVDKSDTYDPTFLGVQRKAKVQPNLTAQHAERGKHICVEKQRHDPSVLIQLKEPYVAPQFNSSVEQHRFGHGFHRRGESNIQQDRQRVLKDAEEASRHESQAAARRVRAASRNFSQFDIITGQPTHITSFFPTASPAASDRTEKLHRKMDWPGMSASSVFPQDRGQAGAHPQQHVLNPRQQRLASDGLTCTKKEWSVAQQLRCNDGFVLPKIGA